MSKYEKNAWAESINLTLGLVSTFIIHLLVDKHLALLFFMLWCCFGSMIVNVWRIQWKDLTETEDRLSDKATAWTVYGMGIIALVVFFLLAVLSGREDREAPLVISRDVWGFTIMYSLFISFSVRHFILIYLLRSERFPRKTRLLRGSSISDDFLFSDTLLSGEEIPWKANSKPLEKDKTVPV